MVGDPAQLQRKLGYLFKDADLLQLALTHRSCGSNNNERLEFLGDALLGYVVADVLYHRFSSSREGDMSRMRAALVKGDTLAEVGRELGLGDYVRLGPGEMKSGGHRRGSIIADTLEAIIGAIVLDSDVETARPVVTALLSDRLEALAENALAKDSKTLLQEFLQSRGKSLPDYQLERVEGEDHCQEFFVTCQLPEFSISQPGSGSSRRKAEQQAAERALRELNVDV